MTQVLERTTSLQLGRYGIPVGLQPYRHPTASQGGTRTGPILIVDDDLSVREVVADFLDFEGYAVEVANDGAEGLLLVEQIKPSLIILDMRMPIMNGWELARQLRARGIRIPILVLTAAQNARRWAEEINADGYVGKPFDLAGLEAAIETLLRRT
jgi:DNA-binding response OmpR family regulator